jgi:hypothetical protein
MLIESRAWAGFMRRSKGLASENMLDFRQVITECYRLVDLEILPNAHDIARRISGR